MRQTFFHELSELEKQEKKEEEIERKELYLRNRSHFLREAVPTISIIFVVLFATGTAMYALYLFIDISRINDIANVHVTKNLNLAARTVRGNVYSNEALGIKDWGVFRNNENGIEVRYPETWILSENKSHLFEVRKYNSQKSLNESLSASAFLDKWDNENNMSLEDFVSENTNIDKELLIKQSLNGASLIRTGKQQNETGFLYRIVFWQREDKIYSLKAIFYNQKNDLAEKEFDQIISVLEIK